MPEERWLQLRACAKVGAWRSWVQSEGWSGVTDGVLGPGKHHGEQMMVRVRIYLLWRLLERELVNWLVLG